MSRWPAVNQAHLSIIVPTKNERQNLPRFLASIPDQPELVICDASEDGTSQLALELRPEHTRAIAAPGTLSDARQRGAAVATGSLLLFADADVAFAPRFFERLCAASSWDAIGGSKLSADRYARYYGLVANAQVALYRVTGVVCASGSNMAIRREVFAAVGGFCRNLVCNEDSDLLFRVARAGFDVRFDAGLVVTAFDHRRLERGLARKSLHSLLRNVMLYAVCRRPQTPGFLRGDWGYWSQPTTSKEKPCEPR